MGPRYGYEVGTSIGRFILSDRMHRRIDGEVRQGVFFRDTSLFLYRDLRYNFASKKRTPALFFTSRYSELYFVYVEFFPVETYYENNYSLEKRIKKGSGFSYGIPALLGTIELRI